MLFSHSFLEDFRKRRRKTILNGEDLAQAFEKGVETAYKAVIKPVEGTILTVAKDAAKQAVKTANKSDDIIEVMIAVVKEAKASLKRTPDLLPVLKEVGVVDSGGQGLLYIYEGFLAVLKVRKLRTNNQQHQIWMISLKLSIISIMLKAIWRRKTLSLVTVQRLWFVLTKTIKKHAFVMKISVRAE